MTRASAGLPWRFIKGFGRFWWDFLVGDTPELFVGVVLIIVVVALLSLRGHSNVAAIIALPTLATVALTVSVRRARRSAERK